MAITFETKYPIELTNAAWQKQKSFQDKTKTNTKTGLGELLLAAEREWKKINFNVLIAKNQKPDPVDRLKSAKSQRAAAQGLLRGQVNTAYLALLKASRKAHDTSHNPALSKTAIIAAQTVSSKLQVQALKLKGIKLMDFEAEVTNLQKLADDQLASYKHAVSEVNDSLSGLKNNPTTEGWEDAHLEGKISGVLAQVNHAIPLGLSDYKAVKPMWEMIGSVTKHTWEVIGRSEDLDKQETLAYLDKMEEQIEKAKLN